MSYFLKIVILSGVLLDEGEKNGVEGSREISKDSSTPQFSLRSNCSAQDDMLISNRD